LIPEDCQAAPHGHGDKQTSGEPKEMGPWLGETLIQHDFENPRHGEPQTGTEQRASQR
jgi:hypothetical protein